MARRMVDIKNFFINGNGFEKYTSEEALTLLSVITYHIAQENGVYLITTTDRSLFLVYEKNGAYRSYKGFVYKNAADPLVAITQSGDLALSLSTGESVYYMKID